MALRHRALARLNRHVPGVSAVDCRALSARLRDRGRDPSPGPTVGGEALRARSEVHERALRGPVAGPNAPLLIRLVRHPYAMRPVRPGRRQGTARPALGTLRPDRALPDLQALLDEDRVKPAARPPARPRPAAPPRPFRRPPPVSDDTVPVDLGAP